MFVSDSESAFRLFENLILIICFCFVITVFFHVWLFDLINPIVRFCGVII